LPVSFAAAQLVLAARATVRADSAGARAECAMRWPRRFSVRFWAMSPEQLALLATDEGGPKAAVEPRTKFGGQPEGASPREPRRVTLRRTQARAASLAITATVGGDLIWQIGTGYFGCRTQSGTFDPELYAKNASDPQVKMVEIKVSQGAKPGHGGILPGSKVTDEIAGARLVEVGKAVFSPTCHTAFSTPLEMTAFVAELRELCGGKPVGFKICIGEPREFMSIVKAMIETGVMVDFIVVDGGEGGTGAAPQEFSDSMGFPLYEGLAFVHNVLVGAGIREHIKIGASGKMVTASAMATSMALGADWCNSARAFMFAVGCIQAQRCNTNRCPVGVTTQDKKLQRGLVVPDKADRVHGYHQNTVHALAEFLAAMGLDHSSDLAPHHVMRRVNATHVASLEEIYPFVTDGQLLDGTGPERMQGYWHDSAAETFRYDPRRAGLGS
jgi:glutamate synthase domain-containing protein 2